MTKAQNNYLMIAVTIVLGVLGFFGKFLVDKVSANTEHRISQEVVIEGLETRIEKLERRSP